MSLRLHKFWFDQYEINFLIHSPNCYVCCAAAWLVHSSMIYFEKNLFSKTNLALLLTFGCHQIHTEKMRQKNITNFGHNTDRNLLYLMKVFQIWYVVSYLGEITLKLNENVIFFFTLKLKYQWDLMWAVSKNIMCLVYEQLWIIYQCSTCKLQTSKSAVRDRTFRYFRDFEQPLFCVICIDLQFQIFGIQILMDLFWNGT